jgi:hypothetical protein
MHPNIDENKVRVCTGFDLLKIELDF